MAIEDFELMQIKFDENTDRNGLIEIIVDLDMERKNLYAKFGDEVDRTGKLEDRTEMMENRLGKAADILAEAGRIHNTPYSKRQWIEASL